MEVVLNLANQDELNFEYVRNMNGHNFIKVQIHTLFWQNYIFIQLICVPLKISTDPGSHNGNSAQSGMSHRRQGVGRAGPINPSLGFSAPDWTIARQEANVIVGIDT